MLEPEIKAESETHTITILLQEASRGDEQAREALFERLYPDLHRLAASRMRPERQGHTLQPTALVHEAYLRLFGGQQVEWQNRAQFFAVVARSMRFILVDHARKARRQGHLLAIPLENPETGEVLEILVQDEQRMFDIHDLMERLAAISPRAATGVDLRFFLGLTQEEVAEAQQIDLSTVKRDWTFARAWLYSHLCSAPAEPGTEQA